jgi:hypothetical protein
VQSYRNRTATPGEELHQIAPNCTRLRSLRQKIKKEKTRAEERYSAPIYRPHLFACKVAEISSDMRLTSALPAAKIPAPSLLILFSRDA